MPQPKHCSYLLRLWRQHAEESWRVTLLAVAQPDAHQHFATLHECFVFLQAQAGAEGAGLGGPGASGAQPKAAGMNVAQEE